MQQLEFISVYDYSGDGESVVLPVILRSGANQVRIAASVDTGASSYLFGTEIAEALGLDLTSRIRQRFQTANRRFEAYGYEANLTVPATQSTVYFFVYVAANDHA